MRNLNPASFRITAYIVTIFFALLIIFPLVYIGANAMKDSAKVYDTPPSLVPDTANSLSIVVDYSGMSDEGLLEKIQKDHVTSMMATIYEIPRESIFEIRFYGTRDGDVIYYARSHRGRIDLEKDHGVFKGVAITSRTLDYPERIQRTVDSMGYEYNPMGLDESFDESLLAQNGLNDSIRDFIYAFLPFIFGIYPYTTATEKQRAAMEAAQMDYAPYSIFALTRSFAVRLLKSFS